METRPDANLKATPLYVNGLLYAPVGVNQVVAIDPIEGKTVWEFNPTPAVIDGGRSEMVSSRAVAWWSDGTEKRIFLNTRDGRLISIDADSGITDPDFGENGYVYLGKGLLADGGDPPVIGSSSPPAIVGDVVVAQTIPELQSQNKEGTPGFIRGFDVRSGELLWTFHTIPQAGEYGNETWKNESWSYTGNTGVWSMISADLELGYIYLPVESAGHDFYGGHRKGDNLFAESLVCLDARTGERVWHYQILHHGLWDYDLPAAPILHDVIIGDRTIKAVTQLTKQGMSFVFDRTTGEPIWPIEERPVPQTPATPGEELSPTQPFPTKPLPYVEHGYDEEHLIDFTPSLRAEAIQIAEQYARGQIYTPPSVIVEGVRKGTWVQPGHAGVSNWNGAAYDPNTRLMFVPVRKSVTVAALGDADPELTNWDYVRMPNALVQGPQGLPILKPPYSKITATNMNSGEHIWSKPTGGAPDWIRDHPALAGLDLDYDNMGQPNIRPSPLVTKSLLFLAEAGNVAGDPGGPMFRAYDKYSGAVISEIELPERASAAPMTFEHEGRQIIVVAVSSRKFPAEFVALSLPRPGDPVVEAATQQQNESTSHNVQKVQISPAEASVGFEIYSRACAGCHAADGKGIPGGPPSIADFKDPAGIALRVRAGGAEMPAMGSILSEEEIDLVSRYVAAGHLN